MRGILPLSILLCAHTSASAMTCDAPSGGKKWTDWLDAQETAGGHAKACHLGVSEQGLIRRIEGAGTNVTGVCMPPATTASVWSDKQALLNAAQEALAASKSAIATSPPGNHIYDGVSSTNIGTVVEKGSTSVKKNQCSSNSGYQCKSVSKWKVIFQKTATDCFMLTAFPTP